MTKITVETATLSDAVSKAARVAPTKGAAFDKAQGILLEIDPAKPSHIYVKSTDLEVTYVQRVAILGVEGDADRWRTPSLFANIIGNLPLGVGSTVTVERSGPFEITVKCGRKKVKARTLDPDYFPKVDLFDPRDMGTVEQFPTRLAQGAWAIDPESEILCGIHIDGERMVSCDRTRLVVVPCKIPVDKPITVPLRAIAPVIRNAGTVQVRVQKDRFQIMPDEDTQITSLVLARDYPNVNSVMRDTFDGAVEVDREMFLDTINRMLVMVKSERYPRLILTLRKESMHLKVAEHDTGEMEDEIDCEGGPALDFTMEFDPGNLMNALGASNAAKIKFDFGGSVPHASWSPTLLPIHLYDDGGFDSWIMPMSPVAKP